MAKIDPVRRQELTSQYFDNARAPGQLGGRSAQMGPAPESRAQSSGSMFANKAKNLLDRAVTFVRSNSEQRAAQDFTHGLKNFDKAFGKLLDAMRPNNGSQVDYAKVRRCLDALSGNAKSATSRGATLDELMKALLERMDDKTLGEMREATASAIGKVRSKYTLNQICNLSSRPYFEQKYLKQLDTLRTFFNEVIGERGRVIDR